MDKDRVVGSAKEIKGSVKETIGKATGDAKLQADGKADKVEGKIQNASQIFDAAPVNGKEQHNDASENANHPKEMDFQI